MRRLKVVVSVSVFVLAPYLVWAQTATTGAIAGVVRDSTGGVLPGVTVEAASPALIEKSRTAVTDDQGLYKIVDLRPGAYVVTFTLSGFSSVRREGLELNTGVTLPVNADLRVGSVEETITVTGASPVVDTQNVRTQNVLTRDTLDAIPTAKSYSSFAAVTVGAGFASLGSGDVGGSKGEAVTPLSIHGATDGLTSVDGMRLNSAFYVTAVHRNIINQMMVQEIVMQTSGASADNPSGGLNINMVPKDGGNRFSGSFNAEYMNNGFQGSNLNDELIARGLTRTNSLRNVYDVGFGMGGPVREDKVWFYGAFRSWGTQEEFAGLYFNKTQNTLFYEPDTTRPAYYDRYVRDVAMRMTWQVTSKQKLAVSGNVQDYCQCYSFIGVNNLGATVSAPEATWDFRVFPNNNFYGVWTYPRTSRLLFEGGASLRVDRQINRIPEETGNARSVIEQSTGMVYGSQFANFISEVNYGDMGNQGAQQTRGSVSYITGSHALKAGFQTLSGTNELRRIEPIYNVQYTFLNRVPIALTQVATPHSQVSKLKLDLGLYVQDQWTIKKFTVNAGLRFDHLNGYNPAQVRPATEFTPEFAFERVDDVPNWNDISPRLGVAYDVFGTGKTAIKASLGRYNLYHTTLMTRDNNPAAALSGLTTRTWTDSNANYVPDCDLKNRARDGECGPMANQLFGTRIAQTAYASGVTEGWGVRPYNWQTSVSVQQELRPGVGLTVGYFRTAFGNFTATDNLAVTPEDYTQYCVTAPLDSRLPDGGGHQICDLYDVHPLKFGQVNNFVRPVSDFGEREQVFNGFDVTLSARFGAGGILQGGFSSGQTVVDNCNAPDVPAQFCRATNPWAGQTQVKLTGAYPLPWDMQASATLQNLPGIPNVAALTYTNAQIAPALGRNLAACGTQAVCNATVNVTILEPTSQFQDRITQLDVRLSKSIRLRQFRIQGRLDAYNLFNSGAVLSQNGRFGPSWLQPTEIYQARFIKLGAQVDF